MGIVQAWVAHWLSVLVDWLPVGYAFGAGMLAAVNPCGFAMLPAYLALYLGAVPQAGRSLPRRLGEALAVGIAVSLGFLILFVLAGLVVAAGGRLLLPIMPWVGLTIGSVLIILGLLLLLGRTLNPIIFEELADRLGQHARMQPGSTSRSTAGAADPPASALRAAQGFFLFGLAYGLASLSCTLPVFMVAAGSALVSGSVGRGLVQLLSYGLGMASVVLALTLALAFVKTGLVAILRRAIPYVQVASAGLLIFAGIAIVLYWWPHL